MYIDKVLAKIPIYLCGSDRNYRLVGAGTYPHISPVSSIPQLAYISISMSGPVGKQAEFQVTPDMVAIHFAYSVGLTLSHGVRSFDMHLLNTTGYFLQHFANTTFLRGDSFYFLSRMDGSFAITVNPAEESALVLAPYKSLLIDAEN